MRYFADNKIDIDCSNISFDKSIFSYYIDSPKSIVYLINHGVKIPTTWILHQVYRWYRYEDLVSLLIPDDIIGIRQVLSVLICRPKFNLVLEALSHTDILHELYRDYGLSGKDDQIFTMLRTCIRLDL